MKNIRVRNLRSLYDTKEIPMRKINVLVGSNSSGKSTFLRVFPLLKQSFNKKINGPILWCGDDDDYVDFGSFEEAINYNSNDDCIKFMFECNIDVQPQYLRYRNKTNSNKKERIITEFSITSKKTGYDYINEIVFKIKEKNIWVKFSEERKIIYLSIDDIEIELLNSEINIFGDYFENTIFDISLMPIRDNALKKLRTIFKLKDDEEVSKNEFVEYIRYIYYNNIWKDKEIKFSNEERIKKIIEQIYKENSNDEIEKWVWLYHIPEHFSTVSEYIRLYFNKVYYIAPVRATAERYYRLRNAAVKEVDCRGKNLPVFLNSLSENSFSKFQSWTKDNLGFEVVKSTSEGHVSLKIKRNGQREAINLSDTGFGYSQILPIVTQLWYIASTTEEEKNIPFYLYEYEVPTTIVIEQPELHLHPALQAKLIDIIVKVAKQGDIRFVIETHSETMINRIGGLIAKEQISNNEIGIIIFEKELDDNTNIIQGGFDKEGYLENWPIGFFEPEEV